MTTDGAVKLRFMAETVEPSTARTHIVATALELFATNGFDATSVEQIAKAAGISRSTFFRQFGGKDDVVFADHEGMLDELRTFLDRDHPNPWVAVCEASVIVFRQFSADAALARRRYQVVRQVPTLRDREIVTVFRYERLFDEYLRRSLPGLNPLDAVGFAALVTAVHNHVLRRMLRGERTPVSTLRRALDDAMHRFGVHPEPTRERRDDDMVVAVFPRAMPIAEVARRMHTELSD